MGVLKTAVDDAVDHGLPPKCAKMLGILYFAPTLMCSVGHFGRFTSPGGAHGGAPSATCKGGADEAVCIPAGQGGWAAQVHGQLRNSWLVFRNPQAIYASVVMVISEASNSYRMATDYRAVNDTIEPVAMPHAKPGR